MHAIQYYRKKLKLTVLFVKKQPYQVPDREKITSLEAETKQQLNKMELQDGHHTDPHQLFLSPERGNLCYRERGGGSKCEYFILRIIEHRLKYTLVKIILTSNVEFKAEKNFNDRQLLTFFKAVFLYKLSSISSYMYRF